MKCGRATPVASRNPTVTATGAFVIGVLFSPAVSAMPRNTEADRKKVVPLVRDLTDNMQCRAESAVAAALGGAIQRRDPGCVTETEDDEKFRGRFEDLKGKLRPPVSGTLVRKFGETDRKGRPSQGVTLRTRPGAQVVAPFDSTVMFAGAHEEYGQLLILSTGAGYHFVLAGMTKIYGVEGQKVLEGEPVGMMPASDVDVERLDVPRATDSSEEPSGNAGPELYFEIRKNGKPINPLPWLATARLERTSQ